MLVHITQQAAPKRERARRFLIALVGTISAVSLTLGGGGAAANQGNLGRPDHSQGKDPQAQIEDLSAGLEALSSYVSGEPGAQVLGVAAASADGVDTDLIALAAEVVAAQNELMGQIAQGAPAAEARVRPEAYPLLAALNELASAAALRRAANGRTAVDAAEDGELSIAAANACGTYDYPMPSYSPKRYTASPGYNIETYFRNAGFHETGGYACGTNPFYSCAEDWTQPRSYASGLGTCSSPRFRNHGRETGATTGSIQYGEPNPEVGDYVWPYWNWGSYVNWWHTNY